MVLDGFIRLVPVAKDRRSLPGPMTMDAPLVQTTRDLLHSRTRFDPGIAPGRRGSPIEYTFKVQCDRTSMRAEHDGLAAFDRRFLDWEMLPPPRNQCDPHGEERPRPANAFSRGR